MRTYFHCSLCDLIFMAPEQRWNPTQEKNRYEHHENEDSAGYRKFLNPVVSRLPDWVRNQDTPEILDFGCGPTAFLSQLLPEYRIRNFDPYFFPDSALLQKTYDLITSTEVWEHFYHPRQELEGLMKLLKSEGILAVMTSAHPGREAFAGWSYRRDMTHVIFFSEKTMEWLLTAFPLQKVMFQNPLWVFQKSSEA